MKYYFYLSVLLLTACAPTTHKISINKNEVDAEREIQKQIALKKQVDYDRRIQNVAYPILKKSRWACRDKSIRTTGMFFLSLHDFKDQDKDAAQQSFGIGEYPTITHMIEAGPASRAGLFPGEQILEINGKPIVPGKTATADTQIWIREALEKSKYLRLKVDSFGQQVNYRILADWVCDYPVISLNNDAVNAYANGEIIAITTGMMRFADEDRELASVIAHELAHNTMKHRDQKEKNSWFGAVFDIAAAAYGINTGNFFGNLAANTHSKAYEQEADYVGVYYLYGAGYDIEGIANFWREMAAEYPASQRKSFMSTHPSTSERFVAMEATVNEIYGKVRRRVSVRPNAKN
ncbi:MAG: hypothetical protein AseanaTS_28220 [Candidatus Pelagadaptatus aseana]|uniref:M48 family metalloprotease n=1 Tax=Candidatus Pelagadaptatus aseana TaxID=3120508 RepID=UPI0039B2C629